MATWASDLISVRLSFLRGTLEVASPPQIPGDWGYRWSSTERWVLGGVHPRPPPPSAFQTFSQVVFDLILVIPKCPIIIYLIHKAFCVSLYCFLLTFYCFVLLFKQLLKLPIFIINFLLVLFFFPLILWFEFPKDMYFFFKLSYQFRISSTLEAQEACWQTNRMIKTSQIQAFAFILNYSRCLPQTPELQGQVRPPRSGRATGMIKAREKCWRLEMQTWPRKSLCPTRGHPPVRTDAHHVDLLISPGWFSVVLWAAHNPFGK